MDMQLTTNYNICSIYDYALAALALSVCAYTQNIIFVVLWIIIISIIVYKWYNMYVHELIRITDFEVISCITNEEA